MFRRKQDVDKHVASVLLKRRDERERNSQGFQIARLYADIKEYTTAKRYLAGFLNVRENVPSAYQLMGEICEGLDEKNVAIDNYKRALDLGGFVSSNRHLVQKICELYTEIGTDVPRMKYWMEQLEKLNPKSDIIFKMKARIAEANNDNGNNKNGEMENIILAELVKRPTDMKLRIKLLQLYLDSDNCDEAFDVAVTCDLTTAFADALPWFECLHTVFKKFGERNPDSKKDTIYNQHLLHVLRNLAYLSLWTKEVPECVEALRKFDQQLSHSVTLGNASESWAAMLREMKGQMFFLAALVLLKRAQTGAVSWQDVNHLSAACLLASKSIIPLDAQAPWFLSAPTSHSKFYYWWYQQSYDRLSQVGHMLQQLSQKKCWEDVDEWGQAIRRDTMTTVGHQRVFEVLYNPRDVRAQSEASYLYQAQEMVCSGGRRECEPFTEQSLLDVDRVAYQVHLGNLNHLVWLCLQRYSPDMAAQPNYHFNLMENIQFSTKNLDNVAAETLCQLDVLVFLLATVHCAATAISENILRYADSSGRPSLLPVGLSKPLVTPEQAEWWDAAYRFCTNSIKDDFSRLRRTLVRGLEAVRLMGSHGVSVQLMAHIARSLDAKVQSYRSGQYGCRCPAYELSQLEERAAFFWENAKQALQKVQKNQHVPMPKKRLFKEVGDADPSPAMVKPCLDEAVYALALQAMKTERLEDAIKGFERVNTPWAKFYSAKIYKTLADKEADRDGKTEDSVVRRKALSEKARDCLYDAIDRLEGDKSHELNVRIYKDLDEIEVALHGMELDERYSSPSHSFHTPLKSPSEVHNGTPRASASVGMAHLSHSTPKVSASGTSHFTNGTNGTGGSRSHAEVNEADIQEVSSSSDHHNLSQIRPRPSPERLDAQLKSVSYSQSSLFKMVLDRNDELMLINSKLMEELRDNNNQLKTVLVENQGLMSDLKNFLVDNRDMMRQIKSELSGLKTSLNQQAAAAPHPPIAPTPPLYLPPHMAGVPPRGPPYPAFPPPTYPHGPGYMINTPMAAGPPRPPGSVGPPYRPSGLPGSQSSNVGKYRSPSDEEDDDIDPDDLASAEEVAARYAECYDESAAYSQYFTPDSQMMPDWPGRSGMDGPNPPMNMPPQPPQAAAMPPRMSIPSPGYFASALRGQSLQYAQNTPPPAQVRPPIGPGYFSSPLTSAATLPNATGTTGTPSLIAALAGQAGQAGQASPMGGFVIPAAAGLKSLFQSKGMLEPSRARGDITILVDTNSRRATILMMGDTKDIIFHHDIHSLALEHLFTLTPGTVASSVAWTATKIGTAGERERVSLSLESPAVAAQLKEAIQKATLLIQPKVMTQGGGATPKVFGTPGAVSTPLSSAATTSAAVVTSATSAAAASPAKPVYGGFTFSQTPIVTTSTASEKPKAETSAPVTTKAEAPKPFAGFTLTPSPASTTAATGKSPVSSSTSQISPKPAQAAAPPKSPGGDDDHVEEYEPNVDFKPVIALPELVEKTTGEENETALFMERCRLYRFDTETKQWKERGTGELKILSSNDQVKFRVIMRRDQIFKLCANHNLNADMKLTPMPSSDRAWCYTAMDFSEEEMKLEQLAAKFKNAEKATAFKDTFTSCCQKLKAAEAKDFAAGSPATAASSSVAASSSNKPQEKAVSKEPNSSGRDKAVSKGQSSTGSSTATTASSSSTTTAAAPSFGDLFKPKPGSWECDGCFVRNEGDVIKCPACGTLKPGASASDVPAVSAPGGGFSFGAKSGTSASGFSFGAPAATTAPTTGGFKFGAPATTSSAPTTGGFRFGAPGGSITTGTAASTTSATPATSTSTPATGGFRFGAPGGSITTGTAASSTSATPATTSSAPATGGFRFGAPGASITTGAAATSAASAPGSGGFVFKTPATTTEASATAKTPAEGGFSFKLGPSTTASNIPAFGSSAAVTKPALFSFSTTAATTSSTLSFGTAPSTTAPSIFGLPAAPSAGATSKPGLFSFAPMTTGSGQTKPASTASGPSGLLAKLLSTEEDEAAAAVPKPSGGFNFSMAPKAAGKTEGASSTGISSSQGFQFSFTKSPQKPAGSPAKPVVPGSPEVDEQGLYITKEGDDSHIHFEPVVALPDKVEVKTGEENEEVLFESRGKLFRFVTGEWKEKGLGVVKILEHRATKKTRVLMRRDQILKICCNHSIDPSLNLQPMAKSDGKAWVWYALDFSEEEGKMEQLALRFKTAEIANNFKTIFDTCRNSAKASPSKGDAQDMGNTAAVKKELFKADSTTEQAGSDDDVIFVKEEKPGSSSQVDDDDVIFVKEEKATPEQIAKARQYLLPDNFYLYENKPPCLGCLGCTDGEYIPGQTFYSPEEAKAPRQPVQSSVISSGTPKFGSSVVPAQSLFGNPGSQSVFGSLATNKPLFGSTPSSTQPTFGSAAQSSQSTFGSPAQSTQPTFGSAAHSSQPTFGSVATSTQPTFEPAPTSTQPTFGSATPNLPDFSKLTSDAKTEDSSSKGSLPFVFGSNSTVDFSSLASGGGGDYTWKKTGSGPFSFAGAGQKLFGGSPGGGAGEGEDGTDDGVAPSDDVHFEPLIPLPDLVEVKTGEEDWKALFSHRSKLYKFDKQLSQWKERGIGEIKIMEHNSEVMFRVLQRREQVLKVSCNHLISLDMDLKPMSTSETALCWTAKDFTESEPSVDQFAVKFKTKELAQEFKTVFEKCQEALRHSDGGRVEGAPNAQVRLGPSRLDAGQQHQDEDEVDEEEDEEYEEDDDDDDDGEEDDEDEEEDIVFEKRATLNLFENRSWKVLGLGTLVVTYNEDLNGNMIRFRSDTGHKLCSHVISRELQITYNSKNRSCEWRPIDYTTDEPVRRHFAVHFSSSPSAEEFKTVFEKGRQLAIESEISENIPKEIEVPEVFSSGEARAK